jgi:hypothetical protein
MFFVVCVDCLDIYFSIRYLDYESELNPVGRWLIAADDGNVALFMSIKTFILAVVTATLPLVYIRIRTLAWVSLIALTLSRISLLVILLWGHLPWITNVLDLLGLH